MGFDHWSHLEGVNCELLNIRNPVTCVVRPKVPSVSMIWRSAHQVGDSLSLAQVLRAQNAWLLTAGSLNISLASGTLLSTIQAAAKAGKDVAVSFFDKRDQLLSLESKRGSLRSAASGLKAWHGFARDFASQLSPCVLTLRGF